MTLEELQNQWAGLSANERFLAFLAWITAELSIVLEYISPLDIQLDNAANPVQSVNGGFGVDPDLFENNNSTLAISVGGFLISTYFQIAQDEWYNKQKEYEEWKKAKEKFEEKLWEKLLKDAKPKGDPGYAEWYYSYYLPKHYGEYGS